jgi:signal transduction histidine kinase
LRREQSGPLNDVQRRQLGLIYGAALALNSIASDVIDLARGDEGLLEPEPTPFSLSAILESVRDIVRPVADEKQVAVRLALPSTNYRLGHPVALSRVLLNLMTNALGSMSEGFVEIAVQEIDADRLQFVVRDSGSVGGSEQMLRSLYRPLRRTADRKVTFSQGALGLALCRRLVKVLGSELAVETRRGWGTRFYFQLTLPQSPAPHARSDASFLPVTVRHQV